MKKLLVAVSVIVLLSGCSNISKIRKYWSVGPADAMMFDHLVTVSQGVDAIECKAPNWTKLLYDAEHFDRYVTVHGDLQQKSVHELNTHIQKISMDSNTTFCELGINVAKQRISVITKAWRDR